MGELYKIIEGDSRIHFMAKIGSKGKKEYKLFGSFNSMIGVDKKPIEFDNEKFIELIEKQNAFDLRHIDTCSFKGDMFTIKIPDNENYCHETAILFGILE